MRANQFLSELRRNPEQNRQRDRGYTTASELLLDIERQGQDLDQVGVSMTELPKLGLNPQSTYDTPIGVYFYPANYYLQQRGQVPFQRRAPYINIFKFQGRALYTEEYTAQDFLRDTGRLQRLLPRYHSIIDTLIQECREPEAAAYEDERPKVNTPAGWIWYVTWRLSGELSVQATDPDAVDFEARAQQRNRTQWNTLLRQLGYDLVIDQGQSVIHSGEPVQGVVLNPRVIEQIRRVDNRQGARAYDPVGQLIIEPNELSYIRTIEKYARNTPEYLRPQPSTSPKNMAPTQSRIDRLFMRYIEIVGSRPELTSSQDILQVAKQAPPRLKTRLVQLAQSRDAAAPATEKEKI